MNVADFFNIPKTITVELEGATYKDLQIRPPTQVEQGLFARYLESCARDFAERSETPEEKAEYRRLSMIEGASGCFDWGSDAYTLALKRPLRLAKMLQFILMGANPSLANCPDEAEKIAQHIVVQRVAELAAILGAAETDDPAKKKAILEAVGLPANFLDSENSSSESFTSQPPVPSPSTADSTPSAA